MIILDSSDNHHERSPLKKGAETDIPSPSTASATAPPPYAPTTIPQPSILPSYQAIPVSHHVRPPRPRRSVLRRLLRAFAVAALVLLLWGVLIDSFGKVARDSPRKYNYDHKLDSFHIGSHRLNRVCEDCPCPCRSQTRIDGPSRVLPIQYPPQITGSLDSLP